MLAETCTFYHLPININYIYIVVLLTVITLPINYYTQRGWHISELLQIVQVFFICHNLRLEWLGLTENILCLQFQNY